METVTLEKSSRSSGVVSRGLEQGINKAAKFAVPLERAIRKVPPGVYVGAGLDCCIASSCFALAGKRRPAFIFGVWSLFSVMLGIYAKLDRVVG
jgi:hypothetical protein